MAPINLPWNKHEIALLLAYCIMIYNGAISMKNAISILSKRLRYSMEKMGIKVSETYRNENGIALQIQSMNCCLFGAKKELSAKLCYLRILHHYIILIKKYLQNYWSVP